VNERGPQSTVDGPRKFMMAWSFFPCVFAAWRLWALAYLDVDMLRFLFFLPLLFILDARAQKADVKAADLSHFSARAGDSVRVIYPIVHTKNKAVAGQINAIIRKTIFPEPEGTADSLPSFARQYSAYWLTNLYYDIERNDEGLLSMVIFLEGYGAYPSNFSHYLNFDLNTGKPLTLEEMILPAKLDQFRRKLKQDKRTGLSAHKKKLKGFLQEKELDPSMHDWAAGMVDECMNTLSLKNFSLTKSGIAVYDVCDFPHAIKAFQPAFHLSYGRKFLKGFLKPGFAGRL
jgi:hypothetical protein